MGIFSNRFKGSSGQLRTATAPHISADSGGSVSIAAYHAHESQINHDVMVSTAVQSATAGTGVQVVVPDDVTTGRRTAPPWYADVVVEAVGEPEELSDEAVAALVGLECPARVTGKGVTMSVRTDVCPLLVATWVSRRLAPGTDRAILRVENESPNQVTVPPSRPPRAANRDRRRHTRAGMIRTAGVAVLPEDTTEPVDLEKLSWLATSTLNVSGSGALVDMPEPLVEESLVLVHLDLGDLFFPPIAAGKVCHSTSVGDDRYRTGIEFITDENKASLSPDGRLERLPDDVFEYTPSRCEEINNTLTAWMPAAGRRQ